MQRRDRMSELIDKKYEIFSLDMFEAKVEEKTENQIERIKTKIY